jgi:two-component system, chemotaxis family, CheB/CheR fusion protein
MDLHDAVRRAIEISKPDIKAKKHRLIRELDAKKHQVSGDFMRLQQVFWNLLKNASKFTPEAGEIRITSRMNQHASSSRFPTLASASS